MTRQVCVRLAAAFFLLFTTDLAAQTQPVMPDPASLVAAYAMDEGAGTSVADLSGNQNAGTVLGPTWTPAGRFGGALSFDGVDDMVRVEDSPSLDVTTGLTLQAWVFVTSTNSRQPVLYKEATGTGGGGSGNLITGFVGPPPARGALERLANLAQQASGEPVSTFTLSFQEAQYDEGADAARIAAAIGSRHRTIPLGEQRFIDNLERAIAALDQPTFDGLNSWYMSQAVREAGLTVALVAVFLRTIDLGQAWEATRTAHVGWLGAAVLVTLQTYFLRAWRWRILLEPVGRTRLRTAFRTTVIGFAASFLLPGRVGEFLRPYLLARTDGLNVASALATIVVERLLPIPRLEPQSPAVASVDYLFEPSPELLLNTLLPYHVSVQVARALLESSAAEHAARMTAMDAATRNAKDMVDRLLAGRLDHPGHRRVRALDRHRLADVRSQGVGQGLDRAGRCRGAGHDRLQW